MLVTWDEAVADAVDRAVDELVATSTRRDEIEGNLATGGRIVLVADAGAAIDVGER